MDRNVSNVSKIVSEESTGKKEFSREDNVFENMTEAQKRHRLRLLEREKDLLSRAKKGKDAELKSFREKVEDFNNKLSKLTEHNDIPRISAAGNG